MPTAPPSEGSPVRNVEQNQTPSFHWSREEPHHPPLHHDSTIHLRMRITIGVLAQKISSSVAVLLTNLHT